MSNKKQNKKNSPTPLQIVKEKFGEKKSLVSELAGMLEKREGESKADLEKRLSKVSSEKLLRLYKQDDEIKKIGGRKALISAIHDYKARQGAKKDDVKENPTLKIHLEKNTLRDLLDQYKVIQKIERAAQA